MKLRGLLPAILMTFAATIAAVVLFLNFTTGETKVDRKVERLYDISQPDFTRAMGVLLGPTILGGNRFEVLLNGDRIFPAMLGAIRSAQKTITFESYIYWSGAIGKQFADALSERARAGVKVHVLLDWVGSAKMDADLIEEMHRAGVQVRRFHQPHWYNLARMNNRTHRKVLITDGTIGFTGGVGISDLWTGDAQDPQHWRDSHFKVEGPVVAQMQSVFLDNWIKVTGAVLHGPAYFPELQVRGKGAAQMFSSSPEGGSESMQLMYLMAITAARNTIDLSSAYFLPDPLVMHTLLDAMKRGVKLRIVMPGTHTDTEIVRAASRSLWQTLLEAGAELYEYQPTMYHCKVMIVDSYLVSVGSTNFDNRSFRLNDEANLNIYDAAFALQQADIFRDDITRSKRITLESWRQRPWWEKVFEQIAARFASQL
jgi:cardiolipin synthase